MLCCCEHKILCGEIWILKDLKKFTARKLYKGKCPFCNEDVVTLIEQRISDGKIFINRNIKGIEALKLLYREKKRALTTLPNIKQNSLHGWIYGKNVQIKNKKGEIVQIRQYSCDFNSNKRELVKSFKSSF